MKKHIPDVDAAILYLDQQLGARIRDNLKYGFLETVSVELSSKSFADIIDRDLSKEEMESIGETLVYLNYEAFYNSGNDKLTVTWNPKNSLRKFDSLDSLVYTNRFLETPITIFD